MSLIEVNHLKMFYKVRKKEAGLKGSVKNLFSSTYTTVEAIKDISFAIEEGEFVGLLGANGAGKTTIVKTLAGILHPTSGSAEVMGFTPWEHKKQYKKNFSIVMGQKSQLWWDLPAKETFFINKDIYDIPESKFNKRLQMLSEILDVQDKMDIQVRRLSLGERMKMELIAAFLHFPSVVFLDEPTIGLDVLSQRTIRAFLKEINKQDKVTIILTSHYMADIVELCEKILIVDRGELIYNGQMQDIFKQYGNLKTISFKFMNEVMDKEELQAVGDMLGYEDKVVRYKAAHSEISGICQRVLSQYQVEDVNIKETSLEDIMVEVFGKSHSKPAVH